MQGEVLGGISREEWLTKSATEQAEEFGLEMKRLRAEIEKKPVNWMETSEGKVWFEKQKTEFDEITKKIKDNETVINEIKGSIDSIDQSVKQAVRLGGNQKQEQENQKAEKIKAYTDILRYKGLVKDNHTLSPYAESRFLPNEQKMETYSRSLAPFSRDGQVKAYTTMNMVQAGSLIAPPEFLREIIDQNVREYANVRPFVRSFTINTGELTIPVQTAHGAAGWVHETGTKTEDTTAAFGTETIHLHECYVYWIATHQMLEDSFINFESFMMADYREAVSDLHSAGFTNGSGTNEPYGFMTDSRVGSKNNGETATLTKADAFKALQFELKANYARTRYMMNRSTGYATSIIKDGNGNYMFPNLNNTENVSINGVPVIFNEDMPDIAANAFPVIIADWMKFYGIVDSANSDIVIDPYTSKTSGKVEYMLRLRTGGKVLNPEAAKKMKIAV